jgi:hypothetical protein
MSHTSDLISAVRSTLQNALDWDGQSGYVDVRKEDLDRLLAALQKAEATPGD